MEKQKGGEVNEAKDFEYTVLYIQMAKQVHLLRRRREGMRVQENRGARGR
jgi:hypothetical protein